MEEAADELERAEREELWLETEDRLLLALALERDELWLALEPVERAERLDKVSPLEELDSLLEEVWALEELETLLEEVCLLEEELVGLAVEDARLLEEELWGLAVEVACLTDDDFLRVELECLTTELLFLVLLQSPKAD